MSTGKPMAETCNDGEGSRCVPKYGNCNGDSGPSNNPVSK